MKKLLNAILSTVLLYGCAGAPLKNEQIQTLNQDQLYSELNRARSWGIGPGYLGWGNTNPKEYEQTILKQILLKYPAWDETIKANILNKKVSIGMNAQQVRLSWGNPNDINRTITRFGVTEQWIYGDPIYGATYLYFDGGILTSFQD